MPAQATASKSGWQSIRGIYQAQRKYADGFGLSFPLCRNGWSKPLCLQQAGGFRPAPGGYGHPRRPVPDAVLPPTSCRRREGRMPVAGRRRPESRKAEARWRRAGKFYQMPASSCHPQGSAFAIGRRRFDSFKAAALDPVVTGLYRRAILAGRDIIETQAGQVLENPPIDFFQVRGIELVSYRFKAQLDNTSECVLGFQRLPLFDGKRLAVLGLRHCYAPSKTRACRFHHG